MKTRHIRTGRMAKVKTRETGRVEVLHLDTGAREWIDIDAYRAEWRECRIPWDRIGLAPAPNDWELEHLTETHFPLIPRTEK